MADVLDYSGGYPAPAAIKAGGYVGVVRYIGTPGRAKNLTRGEATAMRTAGIPLSLVYEDAAGWMRGGAGSGVNAAQAALRDAANCGVEVRCVYFACDEDVTNAAVLASVMACLEGAAGSGLGKARTGIYGEADVIDAALAGGHATYGWQTKAWSGGRVSGRAHLLQQIGYVYPGGVQCDRNTVLKDDWGQWPLEGVDDMTDAQYDALSDKLDAVYRLLSVGDAPDSQLNPDGTAVDRGGHPNNLERVTKRVDAATVAVVAVAGKVDALTAKVDALATASPSVPGSVDVTSLAAALAPAVADLLAKRLES